MSKRNQPGGNDTYRSKLEQSIATLLTRYGISFEYEPEVMEFDYPVKGGRCGDCKSHRVVKKRTYLPDFRLSDGTIVEGKGILTQEERGKFLVLKKQYPDVRIAFVFGFNNKIRKDKPERYSDWCIQHGFDFAVLSLPKSVLALATTDGTGGNS